MSYNYTNSSYSNNILPYNENPNDIKKYHNNPNNDNDDNFEEHDMNIKRRIMERGTMFNVNTHNRYKKPKSSNYGNKFPESSNFGEITGTTFDDSKIDQGMPLRFQINERELNDRYDYENYYNNQELIENPSADPNYYNPRLDFDLYDSRPQSNVSYFDPVNSSYNPSFSDLTSNNNLIEPEERLSPDAKFSAILNNFCFEIFNQFQSSIKNNIIISSPLSILTPLIVLYRSSKGMTEMELKEFFSLPDKDLAIDGLIKLGNQLTQSKNFITTNFIYVPANIPLNKAFISYVDGLTNIDSIDLRRSNKEVSRINNNIYRMTKGVIRDVVNTNMININTSLFNVSTVFFRTNWKYAFNKRLTKKSTFYGRQRKYIELMHLQNKDCRYYADNRVQVLELDFDNDDYTMGFILPNNNDLDINNDKFGYFISQLQIKKINNINIPKFKHQSRYKIDNMFKKMGMRELFTNSDLAELTPSNNILFLSDVIHQAVIIVNENGNTNKNLGFNNSHNNENINFVANHPFIFYIRFVPLNTLLFIGQYN